MSYSPGVNFHEWYGQAGEEHCDEQEELPPPHIAQSPYQRRGQERQDALEEKSYIRTGHIIAGLEVSCAWFNKSNIRTVNFYCNNWGHIVLALWQFGELKEKVLAMVLKNFKMKKREQKSLDCSFIQTDISNVMSIDFHHLDCMIMLLFNQLKYHSRISYNNSTSCRSLFTNFSNHMIQRTKIPHNIKGNRLIMLGELFKNLFQRNKFEVLAEQKPTRYQVGGYSEALNYYQVSRWCHGPKMDSKLNNVSYHRRDDDISPMLSYKCMLRPTWMLISALQHKSKFNFEFFVKKN